MLRSSFSVWARRASTKKVAWKATFFELAGSLAVEIEFIVTQAESKQLLDLIEREKIRVFYACIPARF